MGRSATKKDASTSRVIRHKFVCEEGYTEKVKGHKEHIRNVKDQEKERRRLLRSNRSQRRADSNARNKAKGIDVMDWEELDQPNPDWREVEIVTFDPSNPKCARHAKVLRLDPRSKDRKMLVSRLETEFCRLYSRYRRAADRDRGRVTVTYEVLDKERKYAATAAIGCILKGVTPRQLMEYWHARARNFTKSGLTVPGLLFLSSAANIDTVACSVVPDKGATGGGRVPKEGKSDKPMHGNSFSDTTTLDVRLRRGLEAAGIPTQQFNDRYLLTVQKTAIAMAAGRDIFVGKGPVRDMATWAAENLFAEED